MTLNNLGTLLRDFHDWAGEPAHSQGITNASLSGFPTAGKSVFSGGMAQSWIRVSVSLHDDLRFSNPFVFRSGKTASEKRSRFEMDTGWCRKHVAMDSNPRTVLGLPNHVIEECINIDEFWLVISYLHEGKNSIETEKPQSLSLLEMDSTGRLKVSQRPRPIRSTKNQHLDPVIVKCFENQSNLRGRSKFLGAVETAARGKSGALDDFIKVTVAGYNLTVVFVRGRCGK